MNTGTGTGATWIVPESGDVVFAPDDGIVVCEAPSEHFRESREAWHAGHARLIALAPEMLVALQLHHMWATAERAGPDYEGLTRDTHPEGERRWRIWWDRQLELCARANDATAAVLARFAQS